MSELVSQLRSSSARGEPGEMSFLRHEAADRIEALESALREIWLVASDQDEAGKCSDKAARGFIEVAARDAIDPPSG